MRWGVPQSRLSHEEQIDELLSRLADDWVDPGNVFDVARYAGHTDEDAFVEQAILLVTEVIEQGLAIPGNLTRQGFEAWPSWTAESVDLIARTWRRDHDAAQSSFFVWLEATPAGMDRGRRAWLVDRPLDD
jgi:hypothetical protein